MTPTVPDLAGDLRAAVAAGIVTEAQAASLNALAADRQGKRAALPQEDEPFEFFKGFSEIFISIGIVILLTGTAFVLTLASGFTLIMVLPLIVAAICWWWAQYFTLKRRMNLPSMVLTTAYGAGLWIGIFALLSLMGVQNARVLILLPSLVAVLGLALWYRRFRLPFAMFVLGLFALVTLYTATTSMRAFEGLVMSGMHGEGISGLSGFFDLRNSPIFALSTLVFGLGAFAGAMWFDLRDPYRLGRHGATAFWLHLLAAWALVNTVALTLMNTGGTAGMVLLALSLGVITLLALIIDRRSFLSAAIGYIAILIVWLVGTDSPGQVAMTLLILGGLITALGTWWVQLRQYLLSALPDFPGKSRLPPYSRPE